MADGEFDNLTVNNVLTIGSDTELYRSDTNVLKTNDEFVGADTIGAGGLCGLAKGYFAAKSGQPGWGFLYCEVNGESYPRFKISADGVIEIGSGSDATLDVNLYRAGANHLKTDDFFQFKGGTSSGAQATDPAFWAFVDGDSHGRLYLLANGTLQWGSGSDAIDTNLYRAAPHILKTHDKFEAVGGGVLYGVAVGCGHYGYIPYPYETIQLDQNYNLRFCFGMTERAVLTNGGQLQLPAQGSSGGLLLGEDANLYCSAANTLETNGNFTVDKMLTLPCDAPPLTNFQMIAAVYGYNNDDWQPHLNPRPDGVPQFLPGSSYLTFEDTVSGNASKVFMVISSQNYNNPILSVDMGVLVKKDISAGGFLGSNQGAIMLGHGLANSTDPPKISLTHAESMIPVDTDSGEDFPASPSKWQLFIHTGYNPYRLFQWNDSTCYPPNQWVSLGSVQNYNGGYDTLHIVKPVWEDDTWVDYPAHLDLGNLTAHGHLSVGDTVISDLNPGPDLELGNLTNRWLIMVAETAKVNNLNPIPAPYGFGDRVEVNTKLKINGDLQLNGHVVTSLNPSGSLGLGSPDEPWTGIVATDGYFEYIETDDFNWYDTLDDLALLKNYKRKRVKLPDSDTEVDVIDVNSLKVLRADKAGGGSAWNLNKTIGFLFGVAKQHLVRTEELGQKQADLLKRIKELENLGKNSN